MNLADFLFAEKQNIKQWLSYAPDNVVLMYVYGRDHKTFFMAAMNYEP
jgi:hypothetical protein